jgi:hypothetical protein
VGTVVDDVVEAVGTVAGAVVGLVPGRRAPPVVEVVIWPRRYFPSSVPPQPATRKNPAATSPAAGIIFRSSNRLPPGTPTARKRRSLPSTTGHVGGRTALGSVRS